MKKIYKVTQEPDYDDVDVKTSVFDCYTEPPYPKKEYKIFIDQGMDVIELTTEGAKDLILAIKEALNDIKEEKGE